MPRPDAPPLTRAVVLRGVGFALAVALGAVAVWLIVTGADSHRKLQLGVLAGLWSALLGAFCAFGHRGSAASAAPSSALAEPGSALELRTRATEVERADEVRARRAHEARIEDILRQEIRSAFGRELASLRAEIAGLRTELLEKVGGQLRLERIEVTRVIGSDLQELQDQLRRLTRYSRELEEQLAAVRPRAVAAGRPPGPLVLDAVVTDGSRPPTTTPPPAPATRPETPVPSGNARITPAAGPPETPAERTGPIRPITDPPVAPRAGIAEAVRPVAATPAAAAAPTGATAPPAPVAAAPAGPARTVTPPPAAAPTRAATPPAAAPVPAAAAATPPAAAPTRAAAAATPPAAVPPPSSATPAPPPVAPVAAPSVAPVGPPPPASLGSDPFAGLPRLSPFIDDAPSRPAGPTPAASAAPARPDAPVARIDTQPPTADAMDAASYVGRRRRGHEAGVADAGAAAQAAHHANGNGRPNGHDPVAGAAAINGHDAAEQSTGQVNGHANGAPAGRRRRVEDEVDDDLLARLLAREKR